VCEPWLVSISKCKSLGDGYFSGAHLRALNEILRQVAEAESVVLVDAAARFTTADGWAIPGSTFDGVHFSAETHRLWFDEVARALLAGGYCRRQIAVQGRAG